MTTKRYSAHQIAQVREAMPMYLNSMLGISNLNGNIPCPNPGHEDSRPSAKYYPKSNKIHCYACDKTWDVLDVSRLLYPELSFVGAIEHVASVTGIRLGEPAGGGWPVGKRGGRGRVRGRKLPEAAGLPEDITDSVQRSVVALACMPEAEEARQLIERRGFALDDVLCDPEHLVGWCRKPADIITGYGLDKWRERPGGYLVFPFASPVSVPDGVYRWMPYEYHYAVFRPVRPVSAVKEIKPSGVTSPIYREHLVKGLPDSTGEAPAKVILTEGVFDALAAKKLFKTPAAALMGKGYSRLLDLVAATPPERRPVFLECLDWDKPGQEAAGKLYEELLKLGAKASLIPNPLRGGGDLDPNDLLLMRLDGAASDRKEVRHGRNYRARDHDRAA